MLDTLYILLGRLLVREALQHGPENAPFIQRADARRTSKGKASASRKAYASAVVPMQTIYELAAERLRDTDK